MPILSRQARDQYWNELTERFPQVPAEWSIAAGESSGPEMKHGTSILSCVYSFDGTKIYAAGGGRIPGCDSRIRIWDAETGEELNVCEGHVCGIFQLAIEPRTGILASASEDYSVFLWNLEKPDAIFLVGGPPIVKTGVAFSKLSSLIAIGESEAYEDYRSSILVIDLDTGNKVFRKKLKYGKQISAFAISSAGDKLVFAVQRFQGGGDTNLYCWDLHQRKQIWKKPFRDITISELHFLPDEGRLAAAIISDQETEYLSGAYSIDAVSGQVQSERLLPGIGAYIAISPTAEFLVAAHGEGPVEILRIPDLNPIRALTKPETNSGFCSVAISPDGKTVIAGNAKGRLQKFDAGSAAFVAPPPYQRPSGSSGRPLSVTPEVLEFLGKIKENPNHDSPRLALAEWLENNSDPRGEFVRLQCEQAKLVRDDPQWDANKQRQKEIMDQYARAWLGPLDDLIEGGPWSRGLIHIYIKRKQFFSRAMTEWMNQQACAWAEGLTVYDLKIKEVAKLAALPFLANLTTLELSGKVGTKGLQALLDSPYLIHLVNLNLGATGLAGPEACALASSSLLANLASLGLGGNKIGDIGANALASSSGIARLTKLELMANDITEVGARALAASPYLANLTRLDLGNNYLLDDGVRPLAESRNLANLKSLSFFFTAVGSEGAMALAESPYLDKIVELDLTGNGSLPETKGAEALRRRFDKRVWI